MTGRTLRRVLVGAVATGTLVVLAILVTAGLTGGGDPSTGTDRPPPDAGHRQEPPPGAPTPAGTPPASPELGFGDLSWEATCGVRLPVSEAHGPRHQEGERRYGFARTGPGAVLAAAHLSVQVSPQTGPAAFEPVLAAQVTGPDAAVFRQRVHDQYQQAADAAHVPYGQPLCPIYGRIRGYLLDSYTRQAASVRLLVEAPGQDGTPQLLSVLMQLTWVESTGDWSVVAPPRGDGSLAATLLPASAVDGYTPLAAGG